MHPLLSRQIGRFLPETERGRPALKAFLDEVEKSYHQFEEESELAERALDEVSSELNERNAALRQELQIRRRTEEELIREKAEQAALQLQVDQARSQILLSEKLASIGQLAAGVAHEINNPIGYVHSNIGSLSRYLTDLLQLIDAHIERSGALPEADRAELAALAERIDYGYLREDIGSLMRESSEGIERVRKIVQDLKDFSRTDDSEPWQWSDLQRGIESTLNIANNEIKYRADVIREYAELPLIECLPSQLNQVFMNILVNAAQSIPEGRRGTIRLRTGREADTVWVEISDNGSGIPEAIRSRIFDPFFSTKPVGKGTGLGLSISYGILRKHHGELKVTSEEGVGSTFRIELPLAHRTEGDSDD